MSRDNQRTCQPCTACCEGWLQIVIEGQAVYPGKPCPHCTSTGCNDYANRPLDPCIEFVCAWREDGSSMPEWMKPNNAKVIVMRDHGVWRGMPVDLAVPVGRRIPPRALKYLEEFSRTHSRPLIYVEQIVENGQFTKRQAPCVYGPPGIPAGNGGTNAEGSGFVVNCSRARDCRAAAQRITRTY